MGRVFDWTQDRIQENKKDGAKKVDYALPADFCRVFDDHLDDLYTLSLLLTADPHKADQCFVSGLEDCLHGNPVFREWAQSWARRMVVKNAIRLSSPLVLARLRNEAETAAAAREPSGPLAAAGKPVAAIMALQPLDRFVFVLSVLEKLSARECAMLLDCAVEKVVEARMRALQQLAAVGSSNPPAETALTQGAA